MSKEFDVENIPGYEYMDEDDISYFKKFGNAMDDQAEIILDYYNVDSKTMGAVYAWYMNNLMHDQDMYIVEGAPLVCSGQDYSERQLLSQSGQITCQVDKEKVTEMSTLRIVGNRQANVNDYFPAVVTDAKGGLRKKAESYVPYEDEEILNIVSFGNCLNISKDEEIETLAQQLYDSIPYKNTAWSKERILYEMKKAIEQGKGTCYCCMLLNPEWENLPIEYDFSSESFEVNRDFRISPIGGIDQSYQQINGREQINMMSMLFCQRGGIITAKKSGQRQWLIKNVFTDLEKDLVKKYADKFAYVNWPQAKKDCAEAIWKKFYVEEGYDAGFVAGLIGNMFGEGGCGLLQYGLNWEQYGKGDTTFTSGKVISNLEQARIACTVAPDKYGIGMVQWSSPDRKKELFNSYQNQSKDGMLSQEQLMNAEIEYMFIELADLGSIHYYKNIVPEYNAYSNACENVGDNITYATCILFRKYEIPGEYKDVNNDDYTVAEGKWDEARNAASGDDVPSICQRIIASKIAYEEFMNR